MSNSNTDVVVGSGGGIGIGSVLGIVFIVLKLCGVIHWSWIWVLCPFWIPLALVLIVLTVPFVIAGAVLAIAVVYNILKNLITRNK